VFLVVFPGLYAETNGMIDNYMFDIRNKEYFLIGDNEDQYHTYWWNDGEPLWITATKQVRGRSQESRLRRGVQGGPKSGATDSRPEFGKNLNRLKNSLVNL